MLKVLPLRKRDVQKGNYRAIIACPLPRTGVELRTILRPGTPGNHKTKSGTQSSVITGFEGVVPCE